MLINLWVRDKHSGTVHQVGTNVHDSLMLMGSDVIYYNMQNGDGSGKDGGYEFVAPPDIDDYICVTPDELFLNRALIHEDILKKIKSRWDNAK